MGCAPPSHPAGNRGRARCESTAASPSFAAQPRDMGFHGVRRQVLLPARERLQQPLLGHHATDVVRQALEHQPFALGQFDRRAINLQLMSEQVDLHPAELERTARHRVRAPDQRAAAGRKLRLFERLHQEIVGAQIEGADLFLQGVARREHQHRHARCPRRAGGRAVSGRRLPAARYPPRPDQSALPRPRCGPARRCRHDRP